MCTHTHTHTHTYMHACIHTYIHSNTHTQAKTAYIIPNAIEISTCHHRVLFASFLFRREAYKGLCNFWYNVS